MRSVRIVPRSFGVVRRPGGSTEAWKVNRWAAVLLLLTRSPSPIPGRRVGLALIQAATTSVLWPGKALAVAGNRDKEKGTRKRVSGKRRFLSASNFLPLREFFIPTPTFQIPNRLTFDF